MKKASHKNRAVKLKVRPIRAAKWLFLQSFLKIIFIAVLSTAVFWRFLLIPEPYTSNLTYSESVTHNWCPQLVLLHYFAIKVMFKAFSWKHFSIILYGKSQTVLIISWGECISNSSLFCIPWKLYFDFWSKSQGKKQWKSKLHFFIPLGIPRVAHLIISFMLHISIITSATNWYLYRWVSWNISEVINENSTSAFNYLDDFSGRMVGIQLCWQPHWT